MDCESAKVNNSEKSLNSAGTSELDLLDFLIVGFPKAGTTSLASWLDSSNGCFLTKPKETFCLCPEFSYIKDAMGVRSVSEAIGPSRKNSEKLIVEATSLNVYSSHLLEQVGARSIKVMILTRDYAKVVKSWHGQVILAGLIPNVSLKKIWDSSVSRTDIKDVDFRLDYATLFEQGKWVRKWIDALGHDRVLLLDIEELGDTATLNDRVSRFIGQEIGCTKTVPNRNSRFNGNVRVASMFRRDTVRRISNYLDRLGVPMSYIKELVRKILGTLNSDKGLVDSDDQELMGEIAEYFESDAILLRKYIDINRNTHAGLR